MPDKIDTNKRQLIFETVHDRLQTITRANGYNTQPSVWLSWKEAFEAQEKHGIFIQIGPESMVSDGASFGNRTFDLTLLVGMYARGDYGLVQTELNKILQDVRTCIDAYRSSLRDDLNVGTYVGQGECETDEGALVEDNRAAALIPFMFRYKQGDTW